MKEKPTYSSKKESRGGNSYDSLVETPLTATKNARLKGGYRNLGVSRDLVQQRTSFPLLTEVDLMGYRGLEMGLSPAWQATYHNIMTQPQLKVDAKFASYTHTIFDIDKCLTRNGAQRPFLDLSLGRKTFAKDAANGGLASVFIDSDGLLQQEEFMDELSAPVQLHICWLFHCLDINRIYREQLPQGGIGISGRHKRASGAGQTTPLESYHDLLVSKFDVNNLNIPATERQHYTLGDLAIAALNLFAPISHASTHTSSWTMSPDLFITAKGAARGYGACPWGTISDSDGNERYLIQPPVDPDCPAFSGILYGDNPQLESSCQGILVKLTDAYHHDASVHALPTALDPNTGAYVPFTTDVLESLSVAGYPIDTLPGQILELENARALAFATPGYRDGSWLCFKPLTGDAVAPDLKSTSYKRYNPDATLVSASTLVAWDMPSHKLVQILRNCSRNLTPEFRSLGIPQVTDFSPKSSLSVESTTWSDIVDMQNMYAKLKPKFNVVKANEENLGPFGLNEDERNRAWVSSLDGPSFDNVKEKMGSVFSSLSVPTGIGVSHILLSELFALMPNRVFESFFTPDKSSLEKRQRNLILPAGRTKTSSSTVSSAAEANMDKHTEVIRHSLFGTWRTRTLMPFSDIDYTLNSGIYDRTVVNAGQTALSGVTLPFSSTEVNALSGNNIHVIRSDWASASALESFDVSFVPAGDEIEFPADSGVYYRKLEYGSDIEISGSTIASNYVRATGGGLFLPSGGPANILAGNITDGTSVFEVTGVDFEYEVDGRGRADISYVDASGNIVTKKATITRTHGFRHDTLNFEQIGTIGENATFAEVAAQLTDITVGGSSKEIFQSALYQNKTASDESDWETAFKTFDIDFETLSVSKNTVVFYDGSTPMDWYAVDVTYTGIGQPVRSTATANSYRWLNLSTNAIHNGTAKVPTATIMGTSLGEFLSKLVGGVAALSGNSLGLIVTNRFPGQGAHGEYLIPEMLNVMVRLDLQLIEAAIANYSHMRFYPRALNRGEDFYGLPYHPAPYPIGFMRETVTDLQPDLVAIDHTATSPFATASIDLLRIQTENYDQTSYVTNMLHHAHSVGNAITAATAERVRHSQDSLIKRGQIG